MRTLSYNLEKDKASGELGELADRLDLDVLCLQEAKSALLPERLGNLQLADATRGNRLDLAIYTDPERFEALETRAFRLKRGLHDIIAAPAHERLLASRLRDVSTGRELIVASFHAAPLTAPNSLRRHQIRSAHRLLEELGPGLPHLMVGDYNYPVFRGGLANRLTRTGYDLSFSDSLTYTRYKYFRGHFDFATSSHMDIEKITTLPQGSSDHMAILVTSTLREPVDGHIEVVEAS